MTSYIFPGCYVSSTLVTDNQNHLCAEFLQMIFVFVRSDSVGFKFS